MCGFEDFTLESFLDFTPGKPKKVKQEAHVPPLLSTTPANESKQDGPSLSSPDPGNTNLLASNSQAVTDPTGKRYMRTSPTCRFWSLAY